MHVSESIISAVKPLIVNFVSDQKNFLVLCGWMAHYSLFIVTTYTFDDQKFAVGGFILAICHGNKVVLVL